MTAGAATGTPPRLDPLDPLGIEWLLSDEERAGRDEVRRFVEERFAADAERLFDDARWPRELAGQLGRLGVLGMHLDGYGCAGASAVSPMAWPAWSSRPATAACGRSSPFRAPW